MKAIRSITPGVGAYEPNTVFGKEGKKNVFGIKTEEINSSKYNPGVGSYNIAEKNKAKPKTTKIMDGKRKEAFEPKDPDLPGPGLYAPEKFTNTKQPKWTLGGNTLSSSMHGKLEKVNRGKPAVGQYDVDKAKKDGHKYTILGKKDINYDNKIPGPGSYRGEVDDKVKDAAPRWK